MPTAFTWTSFTQVLLLVRVGSMNIGNSTKSHYGGSGGFINKKSRYVIKSFQFTLKSPFLEIRIIFFLTDYEKPSCQCFFISKSAAARKG